jgi:PAS domain-containing protein
LLLIDGSGAGLTHIPHFPDLTPEANIMYVSDSISDILEFEPHEVMGKSCFDYFHPDDLPFARSIHSQGVYLEKAAVIHYARIKKANGQYQECECVFTVVYDVMVACTSIYRDNRSKEGRVSSTLFSLVFY